MMDLNLKSAFLATRAALERMPNGGRVVNVGTAAAANKAPWARRRRSLERRLMSLTGSLVNELKERRIAVLVPQFVQRRCSAGRPRRGKRSETG